MTVQDVRLDWFQPLNWVHLERVPAVNPVIPYLLDKGESGSLIAQAGAGKSLLASEVAVSLARGESVLGAPPCDPMTVIYIDMENPREELVARLRSMGLHLPELADAPLLYLSFPDLPPLDTAEGGRMLESAAVSHEPGLIVLDTISRLVEGKEDSADTWRNLYNHTLVPLRRNGFTVLRLDHQGHDSAKGARGSSAKRDDVDVAWIMKRRGNEIELKLDKGRGLGHPEKVELVRHQKPLRHLPAVAGGKTGECAEALDRLGVSTKTTRDQAAAALRASGYQFSTGVISAAVNARRSSPSQGTAQSRDE